MNGSLLRRGDVLSPPPPGQPTHTTILVGDNLSLVIDSVGNGAVGVAKGDTNDNALAGLNASAGF